MHAYYLGKKVLDNVQIGLTQTSRGKAMEVLHHVGLAAKAKDYPSTLSGGTKTTGCPGLVRWSVIPVYCY